MNLEELKKTIIPLYLEKYEKHVELIGTGVGVKYKHNSFIITASHVAKQFVGKSLVVPEFIDNSGKFELINVEGDDFYIKTENPDIGSFVLRNQITGFSFLNFEAICSAGKLSSDVILYGYPCSRNK